MKSYVYVDTFNLYYGCLKNSPYKWLDAAKLCAAMLPSNDIVAIRCFTARVSARPNDPDQRNRQQAYLRALETIPNLTLHFGHFLDSQVMAKLVNPPPAYAKVYKTEEKGSDVNLATHLLADGFSKEYEAAIVITNDSDLTEPIMMVRKRLKLPVVVLQPCRLVNPPAITRADNVSVQLQKAASKSFVIPTSALAASQFPTIVYDSLGRAITKPLTW